MCPRWVSNVLEIQFTKVATAARGRGVGTRVMRGLEQRHANRATLRVQRGSRWVLDFSGAGIDSTTPTDPHRALYIRTAR